MILTMYFITYLYSVKSQIMQTSSISHIINCCRTIFYCKYGFYICYFLYHMLCLSRTKSLDGLCCSFCKTHPTKNKDFWFDLWIKFTIKGCLWWYSRKFDVIKCSMSCSNLKILHISFLMRNRIDHRIFSYSNWLSSEMNIGELQQIS